MKVIYVVALGTVNNEALVAVELCLWQAFGIEVRRLDPMNEPSYAYDAQRGQYSSVMVLRELQPVVPLDGLRILAVTEKDLFIPMLSFVFGQAQVNGTLAVISLARLRQEFHGLPPSSPLLLTRSVKEAIHEIGHTFGLTHCLDQTCPMSLSNTISQVDRKGDELCRNCSIILEEQMTRIRSNASKEK